MNTNQSVYHAVEAKVPGRPEEWTRNGQRHETVESARNMVQRLRKMGWFMRILKVSATEELVDVFGTGEAP